LGQPVALITGGARGIGRGIALALGQAGYDIGIGFRENQDAAEDVAASLRSIGRSCAVFAIDLAVASNGGLLVDRCVQQLGGLDVLVANAGRLVAVPFLETTSADFDLQADTNIRGSFFVVQAAAQHMVAAGNGGRIIVVTSDAAVRSYDHLAVYAMTKAAERMLVESAARELAVHAITVNAVAPGTTETDMNREALSDPTRREALLGSILLGRPGSPSDVAHAVLYLASREASFVTGATIAVDGGASIH
jgi:NAD(P)-dependent dehydrogenase (short-subunit alcohol dehydrogenase family)